MFMGVVPGGTEGGPMVDHGVCRQAHVYNKAYTTMI